MQRIRYELIRGCTKAQTYRVWAEIRRSLIFHQSHFHQSAIAPHLCNAEKPSLRMRVRVVDGRTRVCLR
ncbi:MAG: hypothetical protein HEQ35_22425 [Gloeotrichia echinulata IR180]